ncbi:MAG: transcription termination factor Rho [Deltaproteobacteria bacterium]|nr:transcription termination factor Rho [Deltaproteobacteria bacterium]MBW1815654.1 transcription termination factor Rho [Deltaproteobacteria bacterium]
MDEEIKETKNEEEPQKDSGEEAVVPDKDVDKMTVKELRVIAKDIPGVEGVPSMKKEPLLEIVKGHLGSEVDKPAKKAKAKKPAASVKELKLKIPELRALKQKAREANDRHQVDILRRRINRLKKMTRKASQA